MSVVSVPSIAEEALSSDRYRVFLESTTEASRGELASRLSPLLMGVLFSVADIAGVTLVVKFSILDCRPARRFLIEVIPMTVRELSG